MTNSAEQEAHQDRSIRNLVVLYGEDVKRLVYSYVKNWSAADDLVQEVFITVLEKIDIWRKTRPQRHGFFPLRRIKQKIICGAGIIRSYYSQILLLSDQTRSARNTICSNSRKRQS